MNKWILAGVGLGICFLIYSFLPVWSSGARKGLTLWEYIRQHTIWREDPAYIPQEVYSQPLTDDELLSLLKLIDDERLERLLAVREAELIVAQPILIERTRELVK